VTDRDAQNQAMYDALHARISEQIPGFEVRFKDESRSQRALATAIRPFVRGYLENYTTTLGKHVYFPTRGYVERSASLAWKTLAHEYVHLWDGRKHPVKFSLSYVFPQAGAVAALGAVAAIWNPWALFALGALGAAGPWPSRGRVAAEVRGYGMDLAIKYWMNGRRPYYKSLVTTFTNWSYYRMSWSREWVTAAFEAVCDSLEATGLPFDQDVEPFEDVRQLMAEHGFGPD